MNKADTFKMNKNWRKFRLQTNEEQKTESKIKSIVNSVNEHNLMNLSEKELENFYTEVKKIIK